MSGWPKDRHYLSKDNLRVDAPAKVTGKAKYTYDVQPKGLLYGMILRSKWPAARITKIDLSFAKQIPGIKAAILVRDLPRQVRYYGEELAAVAGISKQVCLDALHAIQVEAEPLAFVVHEVDAKQEGSPRVWEKNPNLSLPGGKKEGDVDAAFAQAAAVVEGFFSTPVQLHHPLETHGNVVDYEESSVTAWASTQGVFSVRDGLADSLGFPHNQVRVICDYMGGGFGAKFGPGVEGVLAARLSKEAGAPVKLMLTRFDQALAVGNRPSSFQKIKIGADAQGKLLAFDFELFGTSGIGSGGETAGGGGGAAIPAPFIYKFPNTRVQQSGVNINAGSSRAFRAPGHPPASFGIESIMDELAVKLNIDPVQLRILNDPSETRRQQYAMAVERFGWKEKYRKPGSSPGVIKTGVGCAGSSWGGGGHGTQAEAQINPDGTVEVRCGTQDLGTGARTVVAVVAAEVFGLSPDQITARIGDTNFPPSGGSGGSTTTASVAPAIWDACQNVLTALKQYTGYDPAKKDDWKAACRKLGTNPLVAHGTWQPGFSGSGVGGVQFAEVEVDTETGFVRVKKVLCIQDCGLVVNKLTAQSQANGGILMGIGYALYEERIMDRASGVVLNPNFETYKLAGISDAPEIEVVFMDMPERGAIGIGEPVTIPTAAAVANAVANAIGVRVSSLPITPQKILTALGAVPKIA